MLRKEIAVCTYNPAKHAGQGAEFFSARAFGTKQ